jgi:hypothetical protein
MGAAEFRTNFESGDIDAVMADLAPDFAMYHPGYAEPSDNPEWVKVAFRLMREVFGEAFHFDRHLREDCYSMLHWTTTLPDGTWAEGVDVISEDPNRQLRELRVLVRPTHAFAIITKEMGQRMGAWQAEGGHQLPGAEQRRDASAS